MSKVLDQIKKIEDVDASVALRGTDKDKGYMVEATLIKFRESSEPNASAKVLKKVNAYAQNKDLEKAQDAALVRAGQLLGLEG